ncbi:MAG: ribose-5-phosphate isomerase RpiA [Thermoplasmata archaeon]
MNNDEMKRLAAKKALEYLWDGMLLGVGTGSTVEIFIEELKRNREKFKNISCVASSIKTKDILEKNGFKVVDLEDKLDLYIDGADAVDEDLNLIKGGGGALTREKITAFNSKKNIIIVDETKLRSNIFDIWVPVEILQYSWKATQKRIHEIGFKSEIREIGKKPFLTDNGNYILDVDLKNSDDPIHEGLDLKNIPGVVETGIFKNLADILIIGEKNGNVRLINKTV